MIVEAALREVRVGRLPDADGWPEREFSVSCSGYLAVVSHTELRDFIGDLAILLRPPIAPLRDRVRGTVT